MILSCKEPISSSHRVVDHAVYGTAVTSYAKSRGIYVPFPLGSVRPISWCNIAPSRSFTIVNAEVKEGVESVRRARLASAFITLPLMRRLALVLLLRKAQIHRLSDKLTACLP